MGLAAVRHEPGAQAVDVSVLPVKHFRVGMSLQVTLPHRTSTASVYVSFHGYKPGAFLLVDLPLHEGVSLGIQAGAKCVARYVLQGRVLGFVTTVKKAQLSPDKLLFLEWPTSIQEFALRKEDRRRVELTSSLSMRGRTETSVVRDLSLGGCGLVITDPSGPIVVGDKCSIDICLPEQNEPATLTAIIRVARPATRIGRKARWVGLQFVYDENNRSARQRISDYMDVVDGELSASDL